MNNLKEHIAFRVLTVFLVVILFAPTAVKFVHILHHHEHTVCKGEKSTHIHKVDFDCEFQKFPITQNITLNSFVFELFSEKEFLPEIKSQYTFLSKYQRLHFSLRGPPQLV